MAELKVDGRILKILPIVTGEGKNGQWTKQEFVIETLGEYPKKIAFQDFKDKADLKSRSVGEMVSVKFNVASNEHNDKFYTNLTAYQIIKL